MISLASGQISANPPDAAWSFDEGGGAIAADPFGGHDGILVDNVRWIFDSAFSGCSTEYDGASYVETPFAPIVEPGDSFTIDFAFMDLPTATSEIEYVFGLERTNAQEISFAISPPDRHGIFRFRDDSHHYTDVVSPDPFEEGRWYRVRIVRMADLDLLLMYIDGDPVAAETDVTVTSVNASGTRPFFLGADNNSTYGARGPFTGAIDEVKYYPHGLSSAAFAEDPNSIAVVQDLAPLLGPNPMRVGSDIRLTLSQGGTVCLEILDLEGRQVRSFSPKSAEAGSVSWAWDGRDDRGCRLPGGTYFYKALVNQDRWEGKVILLR